MIEGRQGLRICHLTTVHPSNDIRIFVKECRTLAAAGYDVHIVAAGAEERSEDGVRIHGGVKKKGGRLRRMAASVMSTFRVARALDADLYHLHDPELLPVGWRLRRRGKTVVYDSHEDLPRDLLTKRYLGPFANAISAPVEDIENFFCRRLSAVVAATAAIAERFGAVNSRTVAVNNYPLLEERRAQDGLEWAKRSQSVAYVGGISEIRGIREVVEAMGMLPAEMDASVELAGSFGDQTLRESLATTVGWNRVTERGILSRREVWQLLGRVRAGLVTFHPSAAQLVSQPIKLYEYMAAGIPVIASDFPLWRELIERGGCGVLVNPKDPFAIAAAIKSILGDPEEAQRMGLRGRLLIERELNWDREGERLVQLYDDLLALGAGDGRALQERKEREEGDGQCSGQGKKAKR